MTEHPTHPILVKLIPRRHQRMLETASDDEAEAVSGFPESPSVYNSGVRVLFGE